MTFDWTNARKILDGEVLSVILPVHNLGGAVADNLESVASCFDDGGFRYELVPVDDGSADASAAEIRTYADAFASRHGERASCRPVLIAKNAGKGSALKAGFGASSGGYVLLLDGDLDIAPKMLPKFFDSMAKNGSDIVVGSKRHPESSVQYPWHRRLASAIYFGLVRLVVGLPVTDTQTGMKLFRRRVLGEALERMLVKTYAFDLELLSIAYERGAKVSEAPVEIRFGQKFGALKPRTVREMMTDTLAVFYRLRILHYYAKVEVPPPLSKNPFVSVVIACPAGSWMLDECLKGLSEQTYRDFEVIVLPDQPLPSNSQLTTPNSQFPTYNFQLSVIPTGKVRPAEKRNAGIASAKGDVVAFIDDDAYPDARWLENAVKYFSEQTIGAVGGPGVTPPGDGFLSQAGGRVYENLLVSGNYRYRYKAGGVRRDVDDYPSCNLFVRKSLLDSFGGYRTDFWPGEDTLLCKDVIDSGKRIVYDPWIVVYHHRRALFAPHLRQLGRYAFHRGYFCKCYPSNSLHASYFVPTLFVLYLLLLLLTTAITPFLMPNFPHGGPECLLPILFILWQPMNLYLLLVAVTTFSFNPIRWLMTALGVFLTHVWYGIRFICGLCASKAPCEYIGRDHV